MAIKTPTLKTLWGRLRQTARAGALAVLSICALTAPAFAQTTTITYSEDFTAGVNNDPGSPQVDNWEAFRDGLTETYVSITVGGSQGPSVTCSDPAAVDAITLALNTDAESVTVCEGRTWNTGTCVGTNELSIDGALCTCQGASPFTLRPDVDAANAAWGGIGATCGAGFGAGDNVDQTLTVSVEELVVAPTDADLSLTLAPAGLSPATGLNTFIDVNINNNGPSDGTGVVVNFQLPSGLTFVSDDASGAYNSITGVWTVGSVPAGTSPRLRILAEVEAVGSFALAAEVAAVDQNDPDSTPGNATTAPGEDDSDSVTLTPISPAPPQFCLGRPVQFLSFLDPILESGTGTTTSPNENDVFRFGNISPGYDALVTLTDLSPGTSVSQIDNEEDGFASHFQPTLVTTATDGGTATFEFMIVQTGTNIPADLDIAASGVDIDGVAGLLEFVEVSDNFVEFALNSVADITEDNGAAPAGFTRFISDDNTIAGGTDPSGFDPPLDTEADFPVVDGISLAPPHIFTAFYTDASTFTYRIGSTAPFGGRLNSLAFNCPLLNPDVSLVLEEDFGDVPFDPVSSPGYGNPIHVIDPAAPIVQIGATNTDETEAGNSLTASSDAGDDGVTVSGSSLQGTSLEGLVATDITIDVTNGSASPGLLQAFFDWNIDGDFNDVGEQVAVDVEDTDNDGTITLTVTPPLDTVAGTSFARFRWSTTSVGYQDAAGDGEVEDYQVTLVETAPADLSLTVDASNTTPTLGETVTLTVVLSNDGPGIGTGISASIPLPPGLTFVSSDGGAAYDDTTGLWTLPDDLPNGASTTLEIIVTVAAAGASTVSGEIVTSDQDDPDSTPANAGTEPGEDDTDSVTLTATLTPPVCPSGMILTATPGTATSVVSETSIGNADLALGALSPVGTTPPDPVAAFVNIGNQSVLVLDLGDVIPENAPLVFSVARDNGADNLEFEIRHSLDPAAFPDTNVLAIYGLGPAATVPSTVENTLEQVTLIAPAGGLRFLRFDILNGDNGFIDGISYSQICVEGGELQGAKTVEVFDPNNEGLFALPGNDVTYTITIQNVGGGPTDDDSIFLIDGLPPEISFFNGDADGPGPGSDPVNFTDIEATGLDPFVFANDVAFSNGAAAPASFADCTYTPIAGFDPAVTFVCFNPKGVMQAGDPDPSFSLSFRARIR